MKNLCKKIETESREWIEDSLEFIHKKNNSNSDFTSYMGFTVIDVVWVFEDETAIDGVWVRFC
jgi:hypothetical protein